MKTSLYVSLLERFRGRPFTVDEVMEPLSIDEREIVWSLICRGFIEPADSLRFRILELPDYLELCSREGRARIH